MRRRSTTAVAMALAALMLVAAVAQSSDLTKEEQRNKQIVEEFWRVVLQAGQLERAKDFYAVDMVQHNPNVPTGLAGFVEFFTRVRAGKPPDPVEPTIKNHVATMVDGELVLILRRVDVPEPADASKTYEAFNFDAFRVRNGMIVEHWDAARKPPAPAR